MPVSVPIPRASAHVGWIGAVISGFGALSLSEWMAIVGCTLAATGTVFNVAAHHVYLRRRHRLDELVALARIERIRSQPPAFVEAQHGKEVCA
jgi:hypothetical protein